MATKKDFTGANTGRVYNAIEQATEEATPAIPIIPPHKQDEPFTQEEIQLARETHRTQGRKGVRAVRVNMAFDPDVHDFLRIMARVRGQTITQFTNDVFRKFMKDNAEIYEQALEFRNKL